MFFSAYLGGEAGFAPWRQAVAWHAHWLGLSSQVERRTLAGADVLGFAWLELPARQAERHFCETDHAIYARTVGAATPEDVPTARAAVWDALATATDANAVRLMASLRHGELTIVVPPTTPEQFYFARTTEGWVFADDLRFFPHVTDAIVDECAVYALLQYGAIPPPFTLYKDVRRVSNGHVVRVRRDSPAVASTPFFHPIDLPRRAGSAQESERWIQDTFDAILAHVPADAVLYFSGGVDSGLMAARLARLDRHDVRLVNYMFDAADHEHLLAVRMASHLGFKCELVTQVPAQAADVLDRAGRDYSFPFGDISTIPMNILVHGSLPWATQSGAVLEGTGADGAYGMATDYPKWARAYAVPRLLRSLVAKAYGWLDLWRFDTRVERLSRIVRKSVGLPLPHAFVAQNALAGIAYDAPPQAEAKLARAVSEHWDAITSGVTAEDRLSLLDIVWVCAGRMAPKSFDPLRTRGIRPIYPFLEPSMVSLSSSLSWETKCAGGEEKAVLKRMLAREVPAEWVYRRKSGFTRSAAARAMFASAPVQEFLRDVVVSPNNPLSDFCRIDVVRRLVDRARHHSLSVGAHEFLWAFAFASAWLRGRPEALDPGLRAGRGEEEHAEGGAGLPS
ncbi:MAG: asparagine synthase-related protein [Acidobacteriota bacterium]